MKSSTGSPGNSTQSRKASPPPVPSIIAAARRAAARHVLYATVDAYEGALRMFIEGRDAFYDDEGCDPMTSVLDQCVADARSTLVRATLSLSPHGDRRPGRRAETRLAPVHGVQLGGRFYLAVPDATVAEDMEPGEESRGDRPVMTLVVVDRSAVDEMDGAQVILDVEGDAPADEG